MKEREFDVGECSRVAIEHRLSEGVGDDHVLEAKHKIFLSHSGVQKEFVEHLCKALEDRCHYPFFDKRHGSLPKGKEFPSLIVKAARQCQLLVVVVSEEYFMSKWPMIELNAFVQATKVQKSNENVAIFPLFYGLSVSDLKDEKRRQRWLETWKTFAKDDPVEGRIKMEDWCYALDELMKFNGLSYDRDLKGIVEYENEIVSHICTLVLPDIKWHDSHVQGNMHKVLLDKMKDIGLSRKYKVKVVGVYGVGGIGKTTTCKTLCNELSSEYEGRVCHVEFDSTCSNSKEVLQNAVINLTRRSPDFVRQLDEGVCQHVLFKNLYKQRTFLAIDNVWDNYNSIKHTKMFLETPSHIDSLVLVTARSQSTLALLGIDGDACLEMPELDEEDATSLFLYYAARGKQFTMKEDMDSIEWCIKKCYFYKGDGRSYHYHPLALEALGRQLGYLEEKPSRWKHILSRVWKFSSFSGENVVFDVLRSSFDLLQPIEQALFMDVGLFLPSLVYHNWIGWKEVLCALYRMDESEIQSQLDSLKRKGLLQYVDLTLRWITMHDLYQEFVKLEAMGKSGAKTKTWIQNWELVNKKWVLGEGCNRDVLELEGTPTGGCWQELSRLSIRQELKEFQGYSLLDYQPFPNPIPSLEGIEWQYFSNVLVLELYYLNSPESVHKICILNFEAMKCLRSLKLFGLFGLESLEGLQSLKHLTIFYCEIQSFGSGIMVKTHITGQFPASLKYLYIDGQCVLSESNVFARCNNLTKMKLIVVEVGVLLDLSNCSSLEGVDIVNIESLQTLLGLTTTRSSRLHTLNIESKYGIHIPGLDQLNGLVRLKYFVKSSSWEVPCLLSLTKLQTLSISTHTNSVEHCIPHQLKELSYRRWTRCEAPCLSALKQLQTLNFSSSHSMTQMDGIDDLPALRCLHLTNCISLERLPNLSKLRSLEELDLNGCFTLKLHEEDFKMLATLPMLQPILFSHDSEFSRIRVDIVRRKVFRYLGPALFGPYFWLAWKEGELEELELGRLPIKIGTRGIWDTFNDRFRYKRV